MVCWYVGVVIVYGRDADIVMGTVVNLQPPVNAVGDFGTPPPPGTAPTHLWYHPITCFELHSTHIGIGYAM